MKLRSAVKTVLALVLSATIALGLIGDMAPVRSFSYDFTPNGGTYDIAPGGTRVVVFTEASADDQNKWQPEPTCDAITSGIAHVESDNTTCRVTFRIPAGTPIGTTYTFTLTEEEIPATTHSITIRVVDPATADPTKTPGDGTPRPGSDTPNPEYEDPVLKTLSPTGPDGHQHNWYHESGSTYRCAVCNVACTVYPAHDHQFEWYVTRPATETDDGEAQHMCKICGAVDMREPVGAYFLFSQNTETKINKAPIGGTVNVETTRWLSFQGYVLDALAKRPDVTLNVTFRENGYKGGEVKTVTIPAGYDAASLKDANGYCGFKYLAGVFGAN